MSESPAQASREVICPHCKKQFTAEPMGSPDEPPRGFKCPHCRLFVPAERAADA